jgi:hypothetical protein
LPRGNISLQVTLGELLVSRLNGDTSPPITQDAHWELIKRESTLGPNT